MRFQNRHSEQWECGRQDDWPLGLIPTAPFWCCHQKTVARISRKASRKPGNLAPCLLYLPSNTMRRRCLASIFGKLGRTWAQSLMFTFAIEEVGPAVLVYQQDRNGWQLSVPGRQMWEKTPLEFTGCGRNSLYFTGHQIWEKGLDHWATQVISRTS